MNKSIKIPSEIQNFFSEKRLSNIVDIFCKLLDKIKVDNKYLGGEKRPNCQLTNLQIFQIIVCLPFFGVKGFSHYSSSVMSNMFGGKKDILYSFMAQDNIDWRKVIYRITTYLLSKVLIRKDYKNNTKPSVLIADDSDLPKTGIHMEAIGKIYSHVHKKCILGYKALMLCWSDGITQFMLDFSFNGEMGKIEGKEQGLTAKQRNKRYSRERNPSSPIAMRKEEYFKNKGEKLIEMIKQAIKKQIPFEYLLVDSWFTCTNLIEFVSKSHKKFHLLGMAKMGNRKYKTKEWGELSAKAIISKLIASKQVNRCRRYHCKFAEIDVMVEKRHVKLFFCKRGNKEEWKVLLTTNLGLSFLKAYEIYSMRWAIEVFFSDTKRLLGLSECSAQDFASQIAHVALVVVRYNILASIKRVMDYETIGGLFKDVYLGLKELTVVDKIWAIILEVISVVAELIDADSDELMRQVIENNKKLEALQAYAKAS